MPCPAAQLPTNETAAAPALLHMLQLVCYSQPAAPADTPAPTLAAATGAACHAACLALLLLRLLCHGGDLGQAHGLVQDWPKVFHIYIRVLIDPAVAWPAILGKGVIEPGVQPELRPAHRHKAGAEMHRHVIWRPVQLCTAQTRLLSG